MKIAAVEPGGRLFSRQTPTGCQTVFSSMKASARWGAGGPPSDRTTRLTLAAAASSTAACSSAEQPAESTGASVRASPSSVGSSGATTPTTPVGSGMVKLKYGPATGFTVPESWASLSVSPAYQTNESTAASTSR